MKIGVLLPTREAVMSGKPDAGAMLELAERAEAVGFDSVWAGDSLLARPRFEPLTLLAAAAARTRRVELGTAVLVAPLRHPLLLAHAAATVDLVSQGRLILGVGFGARNAPIEHEYGQVEADFAHRAGRMREQMQVCRQLWTGEPVTFEGTYWKLKDARLLPKPHRPGGPPLWVGGNGPTSTRIAARHADAFFPNSGNPEMLRESLEAVGKELPAGKKLALAFYATVNVGTDAKQPQRELEAFIEGYYNQPFAAIALRQASTAGTAEACAQWLDGYLAQGVEHLVLRLASADQLTQFQRVSAELLPRLRERYR